ncbi:MAG: hypothetical protein QOI01_5121 [Mycobacterium sp.]|jgi:hypothetical protein|nr:hypothetical protein [Mycobacterium sp.]
MTDLFGEPDPDDLQRLREGVLDAVMHGIEASRNDSSKWDPLYQWFAVELGVGDGQKGGAVIGKLVTEQRQIGNRCDEMAKSSPEYAVISVLGDVTPEHVLSAMRKRGRLPSLKAALFLRESTPDRLVIFDE